MGKNYLDNVTNTVFNAPLWVQEVVFLELKNLIQQKFGNTVVSFSDCDFYPAYVPELTFKGKKELETHEHNYDVNVYKCFSNILDGKRIIDITLNNFWTLEETSNYLAFGIEHEFIKTPENLSVYAAVFYIGSKIRLGEYIKRLQKIDTVQLDDVLRKQKNHNIEEPEAKKRIGEILVEMGYISRSDIDAILAIKEESKKRCLVQNAQGSSSGESNSAELVAKINKLTQENNLLKDKLRAVFNIQNNKQ